MSDQLLLSSESEARDFSERRVMQTINNGNEVMDITGRFVNQPLMVSEDYAIQLKNQLETGGLIEKSVAQQLDESAFAGYSMNQRRKPYMVEDGVAIINIKGVLEHDSFWYGSYWTGYDALRMRYDLALDDPEVRGIAYLVNTNGGDVAGNFDLADRFCSNRNKKPTIAIVNERAYSAGYSLASSASKIYVNRTGGVGSIGVITVHFDYSKAMKEFGVKPTLIFAGKHKADGNPYEPLDQEVQEKLQARVEGLYTIFVDTVARNRGMNADAIRATEAATFSGEEAVDIGLADAVMSSVDALAAFKKELSSSTMTTGLNLMTEETNAGAAAQPGQDPQNTAATGYTQAHLDKAVSDAKAEGAKDENERMTAILTSEEAKGREAAALTLAKNPAMSADAAKETLGALPQGATAGGGLLDQAMTQTGGGAQGGPGEGQDSNQEQVVAIDTDGIYANLNSPVDAA